jgi:hypothetical protein
MQLLTRDNHLMGMFARKKQGKKRQKALVSFPHSFVNGHEPKGGNNGIMLRE